MHLTAYSIVKFGSTFHYFKRNTIYRM